MIEKSPKLTFLSHQEPLKYRKGARTSTCLGRRRRSREWRIQSKEERYFTLISVQFTTVNFRLRRNSKVYIVNLIRLYKWMFYWSTPNFPSATYSKIMTANVYRIGENKISKHIWLTYLINLDVKSWSVVEGWWSCRSSVGDGGNRSA